MMWYSIVTRNGESGFVNFGDWALLDAKDLYSDIRGGYTVIIDGKERRIHISEFTSSYQTMTDLEVAVMLAGMRHENI